MNFSLFIHSLSFITLISVQFPAQGQVITRSEIDSIMNPGLLRGEEVLHFDSTEMNVGHLSEDDAPVTYCFRFRNVSKETVILTRLSTSCGCTDASFNKASVSPGDVGEIRLVFNPFEQAGILNKHVFVYTNLSKKKPVAKLSLIGKVLPTANQWVDYPHAFGSALRLRSTHVQFREMTYTTIRSERLVCVNSGETPLKLSALMIPRYAKLHTEPSVIAPGQEADIVITIDGKLMPPTVKTEFSFPVVAEGINTKPSERTIQVKVSLKK